MSVIGDCPGGMRAALVGIAFSTERATRAIPADWAYGARRAVGPESESGAGGARSRLLENPSIAKIGHDLKFDLMMLSHEGIALDRARVRHDARQLRARCDEVEPHDRGDRARASGLQGADAGRHLRHRAESDSRCRICPPRALLSFAGERADLAWQLAEKLRARLRDEGVEPLFRDLELPLVPVLADIEAPWRAHRSAGARQPVHPHRRRARIAQRERSSSSPAKSSTSTRRNSSR